MIIAAANRPGIELVTRDRSSVYASAITTACPTALQVADRWHLLANISEVVERFLDTQRGAINESILATMPITNTPPSAQPLTEEQLPPSLTWNNDLSKLMTTTQVDHTSKRYETFQKVKQLQADGHGMRAVARHLGIAATAVRQQYGQTLLAPSQFCASSDD